MSWASRNSFECASASATSSRPRELCVLRPERAVRLERHDGAAWKVSGQLEPEQACAQRKVWAWAWQGCIESRWHTAAKLCVCAPLQDPSSSSEKSSRVPRARSTNGSTACSYTDAGCRLVFRRLVEASIARRDQPLTLTTWTGLKLRSLCPSLLLRELRVWVV
eukprot:4462125-Prymnesium_polylepis.3